MALISYYILKLNAHEKTVSTPDGSCVFAGQALAQRTVTEGYRRKGNPLGNVSVLVRGTTTGTTTKADGTYSLDIPANAKALVFSSVDMSPVELAVGTGGQVNATLKAEDKTMSEVVVTAFGIKKTKNSGLWCNTG